MNKPHVIKYNTGPMIDGSKRLWLSNLSFISMCTCAPTVVEELTGI